MTNFQIILAALRTARSGAQTRVAMGLSLGDNAYSDCRARQLDDLLGNLGLSYDPMDENSIGWDNHLSVYHRFRGAFNRAVY